MLDIAGVTVGAAFVGAFASTLVSQTSSESCTTA